MNPNGAASLLEHSFRHQAGRITARLTALLGPAHLDLAEESVQEAMLRAMQSWPYSGIPHNPDGWLFRVARNAAVDAIRSRRNRSDDAERLIGELAEPASLVEPDDDEHLRDDELKLIFMCCHPDLSREAQVALSLRVASGFSAREIARAFLKEEATVAQVIVRAKRQIRDRGLTLSMPAGADLQARLHSVLDVLYFMFNEGYAAHAGEDLIRRDVCHESLRLTRLVAYSSAGTPRVHALAALMAFQSSRFNARVDAAGELLPLEMQDRSRWDPQLIAVGFHHFDLSMSGDERTELHAQAAIAATYARASAEDEIQWSTILGIYDQVVELNGSDVVALNRAVVVAKVHGPARALEELGALGAGLENYHLYHSTRGHLLADLGKRAEAAASFRESDCAQLQRTGTPFS